MRVFVAFELDGDVRDDLGAVAAAVRGLAPEWAREKWVAPVNLHLTLAFAGAVDAVGADRLADLLVPALARLEPEDVVLASLVAVPAPKRAGMLWAVPGRDTPGVARVALAVARSVTEVGGENDARRFRAHLTLVRARRPRRIPREILGRAWSESLGKGAERIVSGAVVTVFSSTLTPTGPVYKALARIPVGDA